MSDSIRPSDLPYKGNVPNGVGFCKDTDGNLLWDGGDKFSGTVANYSTMADFPPASDGTGVVLLDNRSLRISDGIEYVSIW